MKNRINFGFLVTTFIVVLLSGSKIFATLDSLPNCQEIVLCQPDPNYPVTTHSITECTYDAVTNTNCCVDVTYTLTRYQACSPSLFPFYIFKIVSVSSSGACYMDQDAIMNVAIQAVISASLKHNISQGSVSIPTCMNAISCNTSSQTAIWEGCSDLGCCRYDFEAGWDSVAYDIRIINSAKIELSGSCFGSTICSDCLPACNPDIFPEIGLLNLNDKIPAPCPTSCNVSPSIMPLNVEYNNNGNIINGKFTVGKSSTNIPCLNLNYMYIKSGPSPEQSLELLIKQALFDYSLGKTLPLNIKVDFWKCIQAINPNVPYYLGCDGGCCSLEFEVSDDGFGNLVAEVIDRNSSMDPCIPSCIEVCSIFQSGGSFGIPKFGTATEENKVDFNMLSITPNPSDGIFDLNFNSQSSSIVNLKIYDLSGSEVYSSELRTNAGSNIINMNLSHLINGSYYIYLINEDYQINKINFIKK